MSKLVAVDLAPGRIIRLEGIRHRVQRLKNRMRTVVLTRDDGKQVADVTISRSELYARIVEETADLEDPLEDPDIAQRRIDVHLLNLCATSAVEWWHKMILLRPLLMHANKSPRSRAFQRECAAARDVLQWVRGNTLDMSVKQWSDKRLNDVLRTWRRAGYAFFALHEKGVRRAPWKTRRPKYEAARAFIEEARRQNPLASASNVHRTVNHRLARAAAATPSTVDGMPALNRLQSVEGRSNGQE